MSESLIAYLATLIVPSVVLCFILWCFIRGDGND
jgi:hypothetical protein